MVYLELGLLRATGVGVGEQFLLFAPWSVDLGWGVFSCIISAGLLAQGVPTTVRDS